LLTAGFEARQEGRKHNSDVELDHFILPSVEGNGQSVAESLSHYPKAQHLKWYYDCEYRSATHAVAEDE